MQVVSVQRGDSPIVLGQPHGGIFIPDDIAERLNDTGHALADTDWHINTLFDGLLPDVTVVQSHIHRYVIDANRDPAGVSLYPGQNTTGLVPLTDFDGAPIWQDGAAPTETEITNRRDTYHAPYHAALTQELARIKAQHGIAILFDCHSIRSDIPFLFRGTLPVLNIGTNNGQTCAVQIEQRAHEIATASPFENVLNGRFKGGWTTRHYGQPATGIHAIQLEIAQRSYLSAEAPPWRYDSARADQLRVWLKDMLLALEDTAKEMTP